MSFEVGSVWNNRCNNMAVCLYTSKSKKLSIFISYKLENGVFERTSSYMRANAEGMGLDRKNAADMLKEDPNDTGGASTINFPETKEEQALDFNFKLWYYGPTQNDMNKFNSDMQSFEKFCNSGKSGKSTKDTSSEDELIKFLLIEITKTRLYLTQLEKLLKTRGYRKEEKLSSLDASMEKDSSNTVVEKPSMCEINSQGDILISSECLPLINRRVSL